MTLTSDGYDKNKSTFPNLGPSKPACLEGWLQPWELKMQFTVFQFVGRQITVTPPWVQTGGNHASTCLVHSLSHYSLMAGGPPGMHDVYQPK